MVDYIFLDTDYILDNFETSDLKETAGGSGIMYGFNKNLYYFIVKDNSQGGDFKGVAHKEKSVIKDLAISSVILTLSESESTNSKIELISLLEDLKKW